MAITEILLRPASGGATIADLRAMLQEMTSSEVEGEAGPLKGQLDCEIDRRALGDVVLQPGQTIEVRFDGGAVYVGGRSEYYRVTTVGGQHPEARIALSADALWRDLTRQIAWRASSVGGRDYAWTIYNRPAADALAAVLGGVAVVGTVDPALATTIVTVEMDATTRAEALDILATRVKGRWRARTTASGGLIVDLVQSGVPVGALPSTRLIHEDSTRRSNRLRLEVQASGTALAGRIVPLLRADDAYLTVATARHRVLGSSPGVVTLGEGIVPADGWGGGNLSLRIEESGLDIRILGATAATGELSLEEPEAPTVGTFVRFLDGDGTPLTGLPTGATGAPPGSETPIVYEGDPLPNLLRDAGVSDDLSHWAGGMPVGWDAVGSPVVTAVTDEPYAKTGSYAARVEAAAGEGIETILLASTSRYLYAWLSATPPELGLRLEVIDQAGTSHPSWAAAEMRGGGARALEAGAIEGAASPVRLRVTAPEGGTFYVDAATLVESGTAASPLAGVMGPLDLWRAGVLDLASGMPQSAPEETVAALYVDLALVETEGMEEIGLGDLVRVRDAWAPASGYRVDRVLRVVEIMRTLIGEGLDTVTRRARLGTLPRTLVDPASASGGGGSVRLAVEPAGSPARDPRTSIEAWQTETPAGAEGHLRLTLVDVSSLVDRAERRTFYAGEDVGPDDGWTPLTLAGGVGLVTAALHPTRATYIQCRLRMRTGGYRDAGGWTYDADTTPEIVAAQLAAETTALALSLTIDEDVHGLAYALTTDGTEPVLADDLAGASTLATPPVSTSRLRRIEVADPYELGTLYRVRVRPLGSAPSVPYTGRAGEDVLLSVRTRDELASVVLTSGPTVANYVGGAGAEAYDDVRLGLQMQAERGVAGRYLRLYAVRAGAAPRALEFFVGPAMTATTQALALAAYLVATEDARELTVPNRSETFISTPEGIRTAFDPLGRDEAILARIHTGSASTSKVLAELLVRL